MRGSTRKEGFYLKKERRHDHIEGRLTYPGIYNFWLGYKNDNGDVHEQKITELAYIILRTENNRMSAKKKY